MDPITVEPLPLESQPRQIDESAIKEYFSQLMQGGDVISKIVAFAAAGCLIFSMMGLFTQDKGPLGSLPVEYHLLMVVGGWLAFFCLYFPIRRYWYYGLLPGLITGPLIVIATFIYLLNRKSFYDKELVFPVILGGLPGFLLWYYLLRRRFIKDIKRGETGL